MSICTHWPGICGAPLLQMVSREPSSICGSGSCAKRDKAVAVQPLRSMVPVGAGSDGALGAAGLPKLASLNSVIDHQRADVPVLTILT
jgi:hypothetical protein